MKCLKVFLQLVVNASKFPGTATNVQSHLLFLNSAQGPVYFLEDGKSTVSLNDALMWAKVNPFSPLGTGIRLNPF